MGGTYIEHHGIVGMHWGQRNGPPYPLSYNGHSASEKKAGWQKSLSGNGRDSKRTKVHGNDLWERQLEKPLNRRQKRKLEKGMKRALDYDQASYKYDRDRSEARKNAEKKLYETNASESTVKSVREQLDYKDEVINKYKSMDEEQSRSIVKKIKKEFPDVNLDAYLDSVDSKKIQKGRDAVDALFKETKSNRAEAENYRKANDERLSGNKNAETNRLVRQAKEQNKYRIDFLEAVQNESWYDDDKRMLKEYTNYLKDPEAYWKKKPY